MIYSIKRFSKKDDREDAGPDLMDKVRESGVIQKVDDAWRIVNARKKKIWTQKYTSKEKAQAALRAYQASKHH